MPEAVPTYSVASFSNRRELMPLSVDMTPGRKEAT